MAHSSTALMRWRTHRAVWTFTCQTFRPVLQDTSPITTVDLAATPSTCSASRCRSSDWEPSAFETRA